MPRLSIRSVTRTRRAGVGARVMMGQNGMGAMHEMRVGTSITTPGCMCIPIGMCACIGCLEGSGPETALRQGRAERG